MPPILKCPRWGTSIQTHEPMEDISHSNCVTSFHIFKPNLTECSQPFPSLASGALSFISKVEGSTCFWELGLDMGGGVSGALPGELPQGYLLQPLVHTGWT